MANQDIQKPDALMHLMAQHAGLEVALARFPDDVARAMDTATQVREAFAALESVPGQQQLPTRPISVK